MSVSGMCDGFNFRKTPGKSSERAGSERLSYGSSPKKSVFACDDCASLLDKLSSEMLFFCFMCCIGLYVGLRAVRDFFLPTVALAWTFAPA